MAGLEPGLQTVLALTGATRPDQVERYQYRPGLVLGSVADLVDRVDEWDDPSQAVRDL